MLEVHVSKRIGSLSIEARFEAPPGITVLFGPSGAGKSSLLRMIAGLLQPDAGSISLSGHQLFSEAGSLPSHLRRTGFVFQDGKLFPHMTVRQNLMFAADGSDNVEALSDRMEITTLLDRRPATLSGGEQQRVAIARALLGRPECLLMDEPMASLDQQRKDLLLPYLKRLRDTAPIPVVYVTHSVEEAFRLADRIVLIDNGRTGISGAPAEVFGTSPNSENDNPLQGGLLTGELIRHHDDDGLSEVRIAGTPVFVARTAHPAGSAVRIRLQAAGISIALHEPEGISVLNRLPATIVSMTELGTGSVAVTLSLTDGQVLSATVTVRAQRQLGLAPETKVLALFKTVSVTPENLD